MTSSSDRARIDGKQERPKTGALRNTGGGYSLIWAIYVCTAPKGMVSSRFGHKLGVDFSHIAAILVINRVSILAL